jgi:hypothetical protein
MYSERAEAFYPLRATTTTAAADSQRESSRTQLQAPGSRAAVLRRSEPTRFSSASDDEVGGFRGAIRSERSEQSNTARAAPN